MKNHRLTLTVSHFSKGKWKKIEKSFDAVELENFMFPGGILHSTYLELRRKLLEPETNK